ncbi:thioredoxin family protein [Actinomycetota bacterium]|nr:thioredoxin family protein [Actinomycetota bacterium]MDC3002012.1 thioredoxin family protein [Actinomycetota bacterium]
MAVESNATELRTLPDVTLPNLNGEPTSVTALAQGRPCVVVFACNHCPYVQSVERELGAIADAHPDVAWVAICSNDVETHPDDDVPGLRDQATRAGWHFDYLVDISQDVARTFGAVCTPDFFVFDAAGNLTYRGAMDDARPRQPQPVDGAHLLSAVEAARSGQSYTGGKPSMGCGIKWREQ